MATALTEHSAVPLHLGLTEPIDEEAIVGYPAVEGAYDPVEQMWKLPSGILLTDPRVIEAIGYNTPTYTDLHDSFNQDDTHYEEE
jgi:hypothetical protein